MAGADRPLAAVSGAGGYVGSRISEHLRRHGYRVLELRHRPAPASEDTTIRAYRLEDPVDPAQLAGVELLVHAAHDFGAAGRSEIERINLDGSVRLFDGARAAGVRRVVFISSMTSFEGTRSNYGSVKLAIEEQARRRGAVVIRPGLVFGVPQGGLLSSLDRLVARFPVLPLIGSGEQIQYFVHHEDLGRVIVEVARRGKQTFDSPVIVAHPRPFTFREILRRMADARGRRLVLVPVPWRLLWFALLSSETIGLRLGLRSDSVLGLVHQDPSPDFSTMDALGVPLREFDAATID